MTLNTGKTNKCRHNNHGVDVNAGTDSQSPDSSRLSAPIGSCFTSVDHQNPFNVDTSNHRV